MEIFSLAGGSVPGVSGAPTLLRVSMTVQAGIAVLHVAGEVDISNAASFADAVDGAGRANRCVIVDLSRVEYLDGSGIRILERHSHANPGRVVVVASKPTVFRLFEVLELLNVLPVVTSLDAARKYLRPRRRLGNHRPTRWPFTSRVMRFLRVRVPFGGNHARGGGRSNYLRAILLALGLTAGALASLRYSARAAILRSSRHPALR